MQVSNTLALYSEVMTKQEVRTLRAQHGVPCSPIL